jgi:hypothetical protein
MGGDRPGREKSPSPTFSSMKRMVTRSILEHLSTLGEVRSPGGQTIRVFVEGDPPSTTPKAGSLLDKGGLIPQHRPLTSVRSLYPFQSLLSLEVLRGLSENWQLQEPVPEPILTTTSGLLEEGSCGTSRGE